MPPSGALDFHQPLPGFLPVGFTFWSQALTVVGGDALMSSSVAVTLR